MIEAKSQLNFIKFLSPPHSNEPQKQPAYSVQSPSSSSQDDGSRTASSQASPAHYYYRSSSPTDSPLHSTSGRSSCSGTSKFSRNSQYVRMNRKRMIDKSWSGFGFPVIEEDGIYDDDDDDGDNDNTYADQRNDTPSPFLLAIVASAVVLVAFCLIVWGVSRPYKPQITIQRLKINNFFVGEGSDQTGVPTKLLTINCTATMSIHNPAPFFGIYVTSELVDLMYLDVTVATGELKRDYQARASSRDITLNLDGRKVPLYGAGAAMGDGKVVPLKFDMEIQSCGYLIGGLMKTEQHRRVSCSLVFNSKGTNDINFQQHSCTYD